MVNDMNIQYAILAFINDQSESVMSIDGSKMTAGGYK